jgi:hypothetical protein
MASRVTARGDLDAVAEVHDNRDQLDRPSSVHQTYEVVSSRR